MKNITPVAINFHIYVCICVCAYVSMRTCIYVNINLKIRGSQTEIYKNTKHCRHPNGLTKLHTFNSLCPIAKPQRYIIQGKRNY